MFLPFTFARVSRWPSTFLIVAILASSLSGIVVRAQTTSDASLSSSPAPESSSLTFHPAADAYVVQTTPDQNYGNRSTLISDQDVMTIAYVQFEIEDVEERAERATFRVWVTNSTQSAPVLWITPATPLDESGVTWNTRPALEAVVADPGGATAAKDRWFEYDVSSAVTGDGIYSFALVPVSTDGVDVISREGDQRQPELILYFDGEISAEEPPADAPILLAAGDIATCSESEEQTAEILDREPGTILALGDNAYNEGTAEQYEECYDPTWGRHKDRTMPVPGNHEYYSENAEPYFDYFGEAAGEPDEGYYSSMVGEWQIIAINTNIDADPESDQYEWVRTELEESTAQCTLVFGHHPRFSSGHHGESDNLDPLFTLFYDHGVEIYLAGHDHSYERFRPQDPEAGRDDEYGVRQFIIGTGGVALRPFEKIAANSEVRNADAWGVMRFTLHEDGYGFEFLAVDDAMFFDSGEGTCHDAPDEPWSGDGNEEGSLPKAYIATDLRRLPGLATTFQRISM